MAAAFVRVTPADEVDAVLEPEPLRHSVSLRKPQASHRYSLHAKNDVRAVKQRPELAMDWSEDEATTTTWGHERAAPALAYAASFVQRRHAPPPPPPPAVRASVAAYAEPTYVSEPVPVIDASYAPAPGTLRLAPLSPALFEHALVPANASQPSWLWSVLGALALFTAVLFMRLLLSGFPVAMAHKAQPETQRQSIARRGWEAAREARVAEEQRAAKPALELAVAPTVTAAPARTTKPMAEAVPSAVLAAKPVERAQADSSSKRERSKPARAPAVIAVASSSRSTAKSRPAREPASTKPEHATVATPAPSPASAAAATGILRMNSLPWAEAYVDGKLVGTTPQTNLVLSAGRHQVRLVNAELDMSKTFVVEIASGKVVTKIVNLSP